MKKTIHKSVSGLLALGFIGSIMPTAIAAESDSPLDTVYVIASKIVIMKMHYRVVLLMKMQS